jgi:hypothetical protein
LNLLCTCFAYTGVFFHSMTFLFLKHHLFRTKYWWSLFLLGVHIWTWFVNSFLFPLFFNSMS